jgi:hypothetical protein
VAPAAVGERGHVCLKGTVIMCFNVPKKERDKLNFVLSGKRVELVDEFKYLGTVLSNAMSCGAPADALAGN